jgi:hypothetical protein
MSMFNYGNPPNGTEFAGAQRCYRCGIGLVSPIDIFDSHCTACLAGMSAEVESDFGDHGPAQVLLGRHRAFADWLRRRRG